MGVPIDQKKAASLYLHACQSGFAWACGDAAYRLSTGHGIEQDTARAFALAEEACPDAQSTDACRILATFYREGRGTLVDAKKAFTLFRLVCQTDHGYACESAGDLLSAHPDLASGGAGRFHKRAAEIYEPKCLEYNAGRECGRLARLYEAGEGVSKDTRRAEELRERACRYDPRECPGDEDKHSGATSAQDSKEVPSQPAMVE